MSVDGGRLPRTVLPRRYDLELEPDLATATFRGRVLIAVDVVEACNEIVLHAAELEIDRALLRSHDGRESTEDLRLQPDTETLVLIPTDTLPPGSWTIELDFRGVLNDQLRGFYRSTYRDGRGSEHVLAVSDLEAVNARRAFPCFDEPDLKAVFSVTLVVDQGLTAISNEEEAERRPREDGKVAVRFHDTIPMSTYLVAFIVGELEVSGPVDAGGVALRVVHVPGRGHLTSFALEVGAFCLPWFTDFYGIPYPAGKCDFIALPDFAAGAMENLGAITFRETALLVDPATATHTDLSDIAGTIAHELAHMWFGDLVTMEWWDGIWLNEAFATLMEITVSDAFRPEWRSWTAFLAGRSNTMTIDALRATRPVEYEVSTPEEAEEMFDPLTYVKGSSVLKMLDEFLGPEAFRSGIRRYLTDNQYGNTTSSHLWSALEAASAQPVGSIMRTWINQGGFPRLEVSRHDGGGIRLAQSRFLYLGESDGQRWQIPISLRIDGAEHRLLLAETSARVGDDGALIVANAGGFGFYRTRYDHGLLGRLLDRFTELTPAERLTLVDDTLAFALAGQGSVDELVQVLSKLHREDDYFVWQATQRALDELERVAGDSAALAGFIRRLVGGVSSRLGSDPGPQEDPLTRKLRGLVFSVLGGLGRDKETRLRAHRLLDRIPGGADPEVEAAAIEVAARTGDPAEYDLYLERHLATADPLLAERWLFGLTKFPHPALAARTIAAILDGTIRNQNGVWVVLELFRTSALEATIWDVVRQNWDPLMATLPPATAPMMLYGLGYLTRRSVLEDATAFLGGRTVPGGEKIKAQALEELETRVRFRERAADSAAALLAAARPEAAADTMRP